MVTTQLKSQADGVHTEQDNMGVRLARMSREQNQHLEDLEASHTRQDEAQEDLKGMLRNSFSTG